MNKKKIIIPIITIIITISLILIAINDYNIFKDDEKDDKADKIDKNQIDNNIEKNIEDHYGTHIININETISIADYLFSYEQKLWNIRVRNNETNDTLAHFWKLKVGNNYGLDGFKINITSLTEDHVSFNLSSYNKTDFLGFGMFRLKEYNKSFDFGGEEIIIWKDINRNNETALLEIINNNGNYKIWLPRKTTLSFGTTNVVLRGLDGIEFY